jgi:Catalase
VVRERSAKPLCVGSIPTRASIKTPIKTGALSLLKKALPFCLSLHQLPISISKPKGRPQWHGWEPTWTQKSQTAAERVAMSETAPMEKPTAPLTARSMFARLAGIGILLLGVAGTFLYLGGWFSPDKLTPARFVDEFEKVGGVHSGFRRNHAKGVCVRGFFDSNGQGARLSKAVVFESGHVPVIGRFSLGGGNPQAADVLTNVRGLGLQFSLPDGEQWRTAMIDLPVFPFKDAQAFYDNLVASQPDPNTHKPDPAKAAAFVASHPDTARALAIIKSHAPPSGFDNAGRRLHLRALDAHARAAV